MVGAHEHGGSDGASTATAPTPFRLAAAPALRPPRSRLVRILEQVLPWTSRLRGGYFSEGVDRSACDAIHTAARRGTLWAFAPPPPFVALGPRRGRHPAEEFRFRSPFASHVPERNEAVVRLYRSGRTPRALVVLNHGAGAFATASFTAFLERWFIGRFLAVGVDVAVPAAPGFHRRRRRGDPHGAWAPSVGAALSAIVQLVHDDVAVEAWVRGLGYRTVVAAGLGIGGTVAALLAATTHRFDAYVPIAAGAHPGRLWMPPRLLARAVHRRALARTGVRQPRTLARLFDPVAPTRWPRPRRPQRCTLVGLRYDRVVPAPDVRDLALHWGVRPIWLPRSSVELAACAGELVAIVVRAARAVD